MIDLISSTESDIEIYKNKVIKRFKPEHYGTNQKCNRKGEVFWYTQLKGNCFLEPIELHSTHIVLPRIGKPLGNDLGFYDLELGEIICLLNWLSGLQEALKRNGVSHHDIHPGNILRDGDSFKLIDFAWMQWNREEYTGLQYLNLEYSTEDARSLMQMFFQLERMLGK